MIQWLAPWALWSAMLLAGPLLVHMLLRRNARRVIFPATHFVPPTPAAAVRFRRPSDVALLMLRLAIVAAGAIAVAQPILVTPRRIAQWNGRTVRAVIVDTSPGMPAVDETIRKQPGAIHSIEFAGPDLRQSLAKAAAWFAAAPPGRREAVIISDFQNGSIDAGDLKLLPAGASVRTLRAGTPPAVRDVQMPAVAGVRDATWRTALRVEPDATRVTWDRIGEAPTLSWLKTSEPAADGEAAARAVRAAAASGVPEGDPVRQVTIRFAGAPGGVAERRALRERWMVDAALRLRRSTLVAETNATLDIFESDGRLVVETSAPAASAAAPAAVRAVMLAVRPRSIADREAEVLTVSDAELAAWSREAPPIDASNAGRWQGVLSDSDGRWLWLLALLLLGVETWARRRPAGSALREARDAA